MAHTIVLLGVLLAVTYAEIPAGTPTVTLQNAATPGTRMPIVGLGTGWYTSADPPFIAQTVTQWLQAGGKRIDGADDYGGQEGVGQSLLLNNAVYPRDTLFLTSKVGPVYPLGYNTTLQQFENIKKQLQTTYVDLLLIHWPGSRPGSNTPEPPCKKNQPTWKQCRQDTWKALEDIFHQGGARAIGVSNFEINHLEDILEMKSLIPAINQVETNVYWNEPELIRFCQARNITVNGYAPLGTPDYMKGKWNPLTLDNPVIVDIAKSVKKSPAQVMLRWQIQDLGIVVNPRSNNNTHMAENLDVFDWNLPTSDLVKIAALGSPSPPQPPKVCPNPHTIL